MSPATIRSYRHCIGTIHLIRGATMRPVPPESLSTIPRSASGLPGKCSHTPRCPAATSSDHCAARSVASHPEQGWSLLCNGVVVFEDTGEILPDGTCIGPHAYAVLS
jgi:hypothetical protein